MSALDAASDLICTSERCDGGERQPCEDSRFVAAAVIRAYLDALDTPALEESLLDEHGRTMRVFSVRQVVEAIRP